MRVESLLECFRFHYVGVYGRPVFDRVDAAINPVLINMDNEVKAHRFDEPVPEGDHLPEFPCCVDMQ